MKNSYRSSHRLRIVAQRIVVGFACVSLFSCSNDDFLTTQSDETKMVSFSIDTDIPQVVSKARDGYRNWTADDPTSFGAFGMYDRNYANIDKFFLNQEVTRSGSVWTYSPAKYWADYTWCGSFDFFGYMPYKAGATLTKEGENEYTLSFPASFSKAVLSDEDKANIPLICHLPVHKDKVGDVINYEMDQVLTGFQLKFKLGDKMSAVERDFVIKQVEITAPASTLPVGGTVSRTYTYIPAKKEWDAGVIKWSEIGKNAEAVDYVVPFVDHDDEGTIYVPGGVAGTGTLRIGNSNPEPSQWGADFYAIPSASFTPTIKVTYDVQTKDIDPLSTYVTTRTDIVGTIVFSEGYFETYTARGNVGELNPIIVQIVPDHLYVLADADQKYSYMVIE